MRTLNDLKENIDKLLTEHPEWGSLPIIYSSDDEGNDHHVGSNELSPAQVENIHSWSLELVGYLGDDEIAEEDINCICIN